jgi:tRNA threonylcarbamoyladenosine biosynthesis protein TsaB
MRVIGIDTATTTASVALIENGLLVAERIEPSLGPEDNGKKFNKKSNRAEIIIPLIESLLESAGVLLQDITGFAISIGPGSFTGLRIGLSTVKGLAFGWEIPVVGVSTLFACAARVTNYEGLICSLLDARKNEVYAALFQNADGAVNRLTEDGVTSALNVIEMVQRFQKGAPCLCVGDGAEVYKHLLLDVPSIHLAETTKYPTVAATVARLSQGRFRANDVDNLSALMPVYMRSPEAEFKPRS